MMKKGILFTAAASVLCLASCSQDDFAPVQDANDNGNVTFTVSLNDKPATRAFGDGTSATKLDYAVYDVSDIESAPQLAATSNTTFATGSLSTTVSLNLVTGRDYKVVFFASNGTGTHTSPYSFDAENKKVSVNYENMEVAEDQAFDNDCFYNVVSLSKEDLGKSVSVILNRPVAQINFGSADLNESTVALVYGENATNLRTTVTGTGYTTLNLLDGTVEDEESFTTTPKAKVIDSTNGSFPVTDNAYSYLHCTYVLVPKDEKTISEVSLNIYSGETLRHSVEVSNVPLQANYRTNIYGNLLTNPTGVTVTKDKGWSGDYDVDVWKGEIAKDLPVVNDGVMEITSGAQLAKIAQEVNNGNGLKGITIKLTKNLNLNNLNWTPIGIDNKPFKGAFDGQNFTISNLNIIQSGKATKAGLFGKVDQSTDGLKNVKFEGVNIDLSKTTGSAAVGCLAGDVFKTNISGISVKNVTITSYSYTGGIVGYIYGGLNNCSAEDIKIDVALDSNNDNGAKVGAIGGYCAEAGSGYYLTNNNSAKNVKISAFRDMGGLFGMMHYTRIMENNTISNVTLTINTDRAEFTTDVPDNVGAIVGRWGKTGNTYAVVGENNTFENYTFIGKDKEEIFTESGTLTQETPKYPQDLYPKPETSL